MLPLVGLTVPMDRQALEVGMEFKIQSRMPCGDEIVIDDLRRGAGCVWPDVALHAGVSSLREILRVDEAGSVTIEAGAVVRVQPLLGWAMTRFAVDAEGVVVVIGL